MDFVRLLFSPEGRTGRREFWIGFILLFVFGVLVHAALVFGTFLWILSTYCWICLFSKRLHDMGRSGFAQLWIYITDLMLVAALVIGGLGSLLMGFLTSGHISWGLLAGGFGLIALAALAWFSVRILFILWIGLSRGQAGDNRYGPEPSRP